MTTRLPNGSIGSAGSSLVCAPWYPESRPGDPGRSALHLVVFDPEIGPHSIGGRAVLEKGAI